MQKTWLASHFRKIHSKTQFDECECFSLSWLTVMMKRSINFEDFRQKANPILLSANDCYSFPSTKISIHRTISWRKSSISLKSKENRNPLSDANNCVLTTPRLSCKTMSPLPTHFHSINRSTRSTHNWLFDFCVLFEIGSCRNCRNILDESIRKWQWFFYAVLNVLIVLCRRNVVRYIKRRTTMTIIIIILWTVSCFRPTFPIGENDMTSTHWIVYLNNAFVPHDNFIKQ